MTDSPGVPTRSAAELADLHAHCRAAMVEVLGQWQYAATLTVEDYKHAQIIARASGDQYDAASTRSVLEAATQHVLMRYALEACEEMLRAFDDPFSVDCDPSPTTREVIGE